MNTAAITFHRAKNWPRRLFLRSRASRRCASSQAGGAFSCTLKFFSSTVCSPPLTHVALTKCPSVHAAGPEDMHDRHCENSDVKPHGPIIDVPKIVIYAALHGFHARSFTSAAVHLRPTGDARLHLATGCILGDELAVLIVVDQRM